MVQKTWIYHVFTTILGICNIWGQRLPARDEELAKFQAEHQELFYDTKVIPDGNQVSAHLYKREPKRFFFLLEEDDIPVSITVTPCFSAITWKVIYTPPLTDGAARHMHYGLWRENEHESLEDLQRQQQTLIEQEQVLYQYSGHDIRTFSSQGLKKSVLQLEITSTDSATSIQIYATTSENRLVVPEVPSDALVTVVSLTKRKIRLSWKPIEDHQEQLVKYCVVANTKNFFPTECAFQAALRGNRPLAVPRYAGFGFTREWTERRRRIQDWKSSHPKKLKQKEYAYQCVANITSHVIRNLNPGKKYYLNVFAINMVSNVSASYVGATAFTKESHTMEYLKDGKIKNVVLKKSRSNFRTLAFRLRSQIDQLTIGLTPCIGQVNVDISFNQKRIKHFWLHHKELVKIKSPKKGLYIVTLRADRKRSRQVEVFASTSKKRYPYPLLPEDNQIKVFHKIRTCNSVTLAWLGTDERLKYCLYKVQERNSVNRLFAKQNFCEEPSSRKRGEKVRCLRFKSKNANKAVITQTIRGLKPGSTYAFDVYASQYKKQSLAYRRVWVTTKSLCLVP